MARAAESQEGYSGFGGGTGKAWVRVFAPYNPSLKDGTGLQDRPSGVVLESVTDAGVVTTRWLWFDSAGLLRMATAEPTNQDGSGSIVSPSGIVVSTIGLDVNASLAAGSVVEVATTISGVAAGDLVLIERSAALTGTIPNPSVRLVSGIARVTTDTINVRFINPTASAVDPGPETYRYTWFDLT